MKALGLILLLSLSAGQSALAQDIDCSNALDQASMNFCADKDYKASDKKLNDAYSALAKKVSKDGLVKLQKAQRAWLAYRDAQCDFNTTAYADGSIYPMIVSSCRDGLTQAQTVQLDAQLNCEEGDMSCGNQ